MKMTLGRISLVNAIQISDFSIISQIESKKNKIVSIFPWFIWVRSENDTKYEVHTYLQCV